jgi:hypothetical protein
VASKSRRPRFQRTVYPLWKNYTRFGFQPVTLQKCDEEEIVNQNQLKEHSPTYLNMFPHLMALGIGGYSFDSTNQQLRNAYPFDGMEL